MAKQPFANPYTDDDTLARVYAEGYAAGRETASLHDDQLVLLDMSPGIGSLDGLKWVGVVPHADTIQRVVEDKFLLRRMMTNGQWGSFDQVCSGEKAPGKASRASRATLEDAVRRLTTAGNEYRYAQIVYQTITTVRRIVGRIEDGKQDWHYDEHLDYS